jgi:hypothetical protein
MADDGANSEHDPADASSARPTGPDALQEALHRVGEAREYFTHLVAAEIERVKLRLRTAAAWAVVAITALVLLLAVLVAAAGLLLLGLAELIGNLLGGHTWLGLVVVGGGILLLGTGAVAWALWAWQASAYDAAKERFAARRRRQQAQFGHSVDDPSTDD